MKKHQLTPEDKLARSYLYKLIRDYNREKYPNVPYPLSPKPYIIYKTNDMENAAMELFRLHGYKLQKHKVKGEQITPDTVHYDFTGRVQIREKGKWRRSSEETGTTDMYGTCRDKQNGVMSLHVEAKNWYTKDTIKPHQEKYRIEHEAAGGTHFYMRTFAGLLEWCFENVKGFERTDFEKFINSKTRQL